MSPASLMQFAICSIWWKRDNMPTGNVYQYFRVEEKKNQNQVSNDCTEFRTFSNQEDWTPDLRSSTYHLATNW
jgi:hypothetical protein